MVHERGTEVGQKSISAIDKVVALENKKELIDRQDKFYPEVYIKSVWEDTAVQPVVEAQGRSRIYLGKEQQEALKRLK